MQCGASRMHYPYFETHIRSVTRYELCWESFQFHFQTLSDIFEIVKAPQINITVGLINQLHHSLMRSSRILFSGRLNYIGVGVTRQTTQTNVVIGTPSGQKVQCCPFDSVDSELAIFCVRYNVSGPQLQPKNSLKIETESRSS